MDCAKVGQLIRNLRKEQNLSQQALADRLGISNKTVSKWETGKGAPDVSLWQGLADALGADVRKLLSGNLVPNSADVGKLERVRFYVCPVCGNILTSTGQADIACCGRKLSPLSPQELDAAHAVSLIRTDDDYYLSFAHPMEKDHFIDFVCYVFNDRIWFQRLYPEQAAALHLPLGRSGALYLHCSRHGLYKISRPVQLCE